jgi:uncharacterized protein
LAVTDGVILDTGPLVAYLAQEDDFHDWATQTFSSLPPLFWSCEAVLAEVAFLLHSDPKAMKLIGKWLENGWIQLPFRFAEHHAPVLALMTQYHSLPMDFADACLVRMAELMPEARVLTIDSDFRVYRKNRREVIRTIMPPQE